VLARLAEPDRNVAKANPDLEQQIREYQYQIGPQDVLSFTVWDHPELTIPAGEVREAALQGHLVGPSGQIFYPFIGEVEVMNRTVSDVRVEVTERLARVIQDPQLDVRVAAFRSRKVQVSGNVAMPGSVPLTDIPLTLVDALSQAGGVTPEGALQSVQVIRGGESRTFDVQSLLERGDMHQNMLLRDGDLVYVPENSFYAVHVLGEVAQRGSVPMASGRLNLAEVLSLSGSFEPTNADPERLFIFRGAYEKPEVFWLDARSPDAMLLATQFEMRPQEVVFVASAGLTRWNRAISLILPSVQTLWQTQSLIERLRDE
jgi:polysaccharide export outer membrane protein